MSRDKTQRNLERGQGLYFAHDSGARQIAHEEMPQPRHGGVRVTRQRVKTAFSEDIQVRHRQTFGFYAILLASFACIVAIFAMSIQLQSNMAQLEASENHLAALVASNNARQSEIHANLDWRMIEYVALNQLGMMPPEDFQVVVARARPPEIAPEATDPEILQSGFSFPNFWRTLVGSQ
ncbi:MAG: hypothetical protein FWE21_01320 [Defluviitaleaceae bacterium]|nr:hypothetical protein [Defluviitaleaceae bacterium]